MRKCPTISRDVLTILKMILKKYKQFIIYGKKVKIRIHEKIRNDENNLIKIDKLKLYNFMKYGHYNTYDEIKNYVNKVTLKGIDDDYIEKLNKELNKIINLKKIQT